MQLKSLVTAVLATMALLAGPLAAHAGIVISVTESGNNVVITGSGSANTAGLNYFQNGLSTAYVQSSSAFGDGLILGNTFASGLSLWRGFTASANPFSEPAGTAVQHASSGGGDAFGINSIPTIDLPQNYVSGSALSATDTYNNTTISSLGLIEGTYTYTWGAGNTADSLVLTIGTPAVPTPTPLAASAVLSLPLLAFRRR